jgi:Zn-dependent protease with chaperone function
MLPEHPILLQRRLGITDTRFLLVSAGLFAASSFLLFAEASALIRLSMAFYDVNLSWWARFIGPIAVIVAGLLLANFWLKARATRQSVSLEVEFNAARHQNFVNLIRQVLKHSQITDTVHLRYLPWSDDPNAHVTKRSGTFYVTLTRGLARLYQTHPLQAESIVSHEISHIEADDIRFTNATRDGAEAALILILGMNAVLLAVYLVQLLVFKSSDNGLPVAGAIITSATAPIAGFFYYREYLLGREYVHDLRAVQLMHTAKPMGEYLSTLEAANKRSGFWPKLILQIRHFRAFHPTPTARLHNLSRLDPYRGWGVITPIFAGMFLALLPIQLALARSAISFPIMWLKVSEWVLLAIATFLLVRSDLSRLSVYIIQRNRVALRIPAFFALVLAGSLSAVLPFIGLSSAVRGRPLVPALEYAANGVLWTAIGYSGAALLLAYVWGVYFLCNPRGWRLILAGLLQLFSLATLVFFYLITLSRGETSFPLFPGLLTWALFSFALGWVCTACSRCDSCHKRPWNALLLRDTCSSCGMLRLPRRVMDPTSA